MLKSKAMEEVAEKFFYCISDIAPHFLQFWIQPLSGSWFLRCRIASNTTNISRESSVGTISYMAPEAVKQGAVKIGRPSDVWSLGIILCDTQSGDVGGWTGGFSLGFGPLAGMDHLEVFVINRGKLRKVRVSSRPWHHPFSFQVATTWS